MTSLDVELMFQLTEKEDMFVSRLIIRNFRGLQSADISFGPGLNVLVGRNGSGKSTVVSALRLLLDTSLGGNARNLEESDLHGNDKFTGPANVVIAAHFSGFTNSTIDKRMRLNLVASADVSKWLLYRYRPKEAARTDLANNVRALTDLNRSDYESERLVGVSDDPHSLRWNDATTGADFTDRSLRDFYVNEIPALRDVVADMRRERTSPLTNLLDNYTVSPADQAKVEGAYIAAQTVVEQVPQFSQLAKAVETTYLSLTGEINLSMRLGLTKPAFSSIARDLGVLLTDQLVSDMELRRNGLGLNNLLHISMLLDSFRHGLGQDQIPLLLFEEPEAHLHPQAQTALLNAIREQKFQTIVTTHSPYVAMSGGIETVINLDRDDAVKGMNLAASGRFTQDELDDLNRFMAADRGALFFASVVILVEGPSEQILLPAYAGRDGHDLSRLGIQICAVNGTHFDLYKRLLGPNGMNRPYIAVRDQDAQSGANRMLLPILDDGRNVSTAPGEFATQTTLEYAITQVSTAPALKETLLAFGMTKTAALFGEEMPTAITGELQKAVLKASSRAGKARFAQAFAQRIRRDRLPAPPYIEEALKAAIALRHPAPAPARP